MLNLFLTRAFFNLILFSTRKKGMLFYQSETFFNIASNISSIAFNIALFFSYSIIAPSSASPLSTTSLNTAFIISYSSLVCNKPASAHAAVARKLDLRNLGGNAANFSYTCSTNSVFP